MNVDFLQARITATESAIVAYEDVLQKLALNPARSYTINTGQTTESVTRWDAERIQALIESLYSQLDTLNYRLNGGASIVVVPGF